MSQLYQIADKLQIDPQLDFQLPVYNIQKGAAHFTRSTQLASSASNSELGFNVQIGRTANLISAYMVYELPLTVSILGTGFTGTLEQGTFTDNLAFRQWAYGSVTSTSNISVNNNQISCQPRFFIHELSKFDGGESSGEVAIQESIFPAMKDTTQAYSQSVGSLLNPLAGYLTGGTPFTCQPRGMFNVDFNSTSYSATGASFTVTYYEPVISPVCTYNPRKPKPAFAYVNQLQLNNTMSNLVRMFSINYDNVPSATSISVTLGVSAQLHYWQLTSPVGLQLPVPFQVKGFNRIQVQQSQGATTIAAGASASIVGPTLTVSSIPKKIFCYIKRAVTDGSDVSSIAACNQTDTCMRINSLTVLFDNQPNLIANYDTRDLYNNLAAAEGIDSTFIAWKNYEGSVVALDPVRDFGLQPDQAPGLISDKYQLQITANVTNIHPTESIVPSIYIVTAISSVLTTTPEGVTNISEGVLSRDAIANAFNLETVPANYAVLHDDIYGGSIFDKFKSAAQKAFKFVKDKGVPLARKTKALSKLAYNIPEYGEVLGPLIASAGFGKLTKAQMQQRLMSTMM